MGQPGQRRDDDEQGGKTICRARPGSVIGNSMGFRLVVDSRTLDVTITVG
jgi:hypothetical protein